jgi:hypothetical protein
MTEWGVSGGIALHRTGLGNTDIPGANYIQMMVDKGKDISRVLPVLRGFDN